MLAELSLQGVWDATKTYAVGLWDYVSNPWILAGVAAVVILIVVLTLLSKRQPSKIRAFNNNNGYVDISRTALIDIIRSTSEQVDIEKKPGVQIQTKRGKLNVDVKIRLLPTRRLTEVSEILQKHLMETLQDGLGIRKLGSINVIVVGVRVKTGKEARRGLPLHKKADRTEATQVAETVEVVNEPAEEKKDDFLASTEPTGEIEEPNAVDSSEADEHPESKRDQV